MLDGLFRRPWIGLLVVLVTYVARWLVLQYDLHASDPLWYAEVANDLAFHTSGLFAQHNTYPFVMRLGVTVPIALAYRVVGVSTFVTNLPCLIAGVSIIAISYAAVETPRTKWLAMGFCLVCTPLWLDGRELTPDLPCGAAMALSILCLARRGRPRGAGWLVAAVVIWFLAFQIKEIAIWCAPVWAYAVLCDLRDRGGKATLRSFAPAAVVGVVLAVGYMALCALLWLSPLARFHGIDPLKHAWALDAEPTGRWVARLGWEPIGLMYRMFRATVVLIVLSPWLVRGRDRIWVVATLAIILLYWFGSASVSHYSPLPITRRMLLPALPGVVVVSALTTNAALDRIHRARWRTMLLAVMVLTLVVPDLHATYKAVRRREHPQREVYDHLRAEVTRTSDRIIVVCDDFRCASLARFYFGFQPPPHLAIVTASEFASAPPPAAARVLLIAFVSGSHGVGPEIASRAESLGLRAMRRYPQVRMYDAGDGAPLHRSLAVPLRQPGHS